MGRWEARNIGQMRGGDGRELGISDPQHSWGYEDGLWKGLEPPLLVTADF